MVRRGGEEARRRTPDRAHYPYSYPSRHAPPLRFSESGKMVLGMFAKIKDRASIVSHEA